MRSATEHLNEWDKAVQGHPAEQRENVCWHRTRQIEQDDERMKLWGTPLDIALEPFVEEYDSWGRALSER